MGMSCVFFQEVDMHVLHAAASQADVFVIATPVSVSQSQASKI